MTILDGKSLSNKIKGELKAKVSALVEQYQVKPGMAIVEVGNDTASEIYVRNKVRAANFVGINARLIKKDSSISQEELLKLIDELNADEGIHGIIVQLPLPKHMDERVVIDRIDPNKDIDGFGILNKGKLFSGMKCFQPATPL